MALVNHLIMDLLRIITPEEVGEITTTHNGGKFISLTTIVNERVQKNIFRNFALPIEDIEGEDTAKILPFRSKENQNEINEELHLSESAKIVLDEEGLKASLNTLARKMVGKNSPVENEKIEHVENENMSSFILIEKARLKRSQKVLKQKEILELYQKNINVDVEQIKGQQNDIGEVKESGVLINKKHY